MMDSYYNIKIIDFGDAKQVEEQANPRPSLINTIVEEAKGEDQLDEEDEFEFDSNGSESEEESASTGKGPRMRADTFVGTVNYQSPEVIDCLDHTPALDTWAFGNILFKMLVGSVPFKGTNPM